MILRTVLQLRPVIGTPRIFSALAARLDLPTLIKPTIGHMKPFALHFQKREFLDIGPSRSGNKKSKKQIAGVGFILGNGLSLFAFRRRFTEATKGQGPEEGPLACSVSFFRNRPSPLPPRIEATPIP